MNLPRVPIYCQTPTTPERRRPTPNRRPPTPDRRPPTADRRPPTPNPQHATPNTQHATPNTQPPTPNTQHPTPNDPDTQHPTPNTQRPRQLKIAPGAVDLRGDAAAAQRLDALHADVSGRMEKALQGAVRFKRWGMHYNRALLRAHQLQLCTNFMDPGLQLYGGDLFLALKAQGDRIFLGLPPPTANRPPPPPVARAPVVSGPTAAERQAARAAQAAQRAARPPSPDMTTYYVSRLADQLPTVAVATLRPPSNPPANPLT